MFADGSVLLYILAGEVGSRSKVIVMLSTHCEFDPITKFLTLIPPTSLGLRRPVK